MVFAVPRIGCRYRKKAKEETTVIYKEFQDLKLSALGFGTMRLPTIDGNDGKIDEKAAAEM